MKKGKEFRVYLSFSKKSPLSLYFTYRNNIVTCRTATAAPNAISVLNTILNTGQPHEPDSGDSHQTGRVQQHKHQQSQGGGGRPAPVVADLLRQRRGIFGIDVAEGIGRAERGDDDFLRRETAHQRDVRAPVKPGGTGQRFQRHAEAACKRVLKCPLRALAVQGRKLLFKSGHIAARSLRRLKVRFDGLLLAREMRPLPLCRPSPSGGIRRR